MSTGSRPAVEDANDGVRCRPLAAFVSVVTVVAAGDLARLEPDLENLERTLADETDQHEVVLVLLGTSATARDEAQVLVRRVPDIQTIGIASTASEEVGLTVGLDAALGDVVVTARLGVDPPEAVVRCARLVSPHAPIVYGLDRTRIGTWWERAGMGVVRWLVSRGVGQEAPDLSLGLAAYARAALAPWMIRTDRHRVLPLLPTLSGYPSLLMPYETGHPPRHRARRAWSSTARVMKAVFYASARPLRFAVRLALVGSAVNLLYAGYVVVISLFRGAVEGWTSLSLQASIMFFLMSVVLATMAEYMYQSFAAGTGRSIYRVDFEATSTRLGIVGRLNIETLPPDDTGPGDA